MRQKYLRPKHFWKEIKNILDGHIFYRWLPLVHNFSIFLPLGLMRFFFDDSGFLCSFFRITRGSGASGWISFTLINLILVNLLFFVLVLDSFGGLFKKSDIDRLSRCFFSSRIKISDFRAKLLFCLLSEYFEEFFSSESKKNLQSL